MEDGAVQRQRLKARPGRAGLQAEPVICRAAIPDRLSPSRPKASRACSESALHRSFSWIVPLAPNGRGPKALVFARCQCGACGPGAYNCPPQRGPGQAPFLSLRRGERWLGEAETEWGNHLATSATVIGGAPGAGIVSPCAQGSTPTPSSFARHLSPDRRGRGKAPSATAAEGGQADEGQRPRAKQGAPRSSPSPHQRPDPANKSQHQERITYGGQWRRNRQQGRAPEDHASRNDKQHGGHERGEPHPRASRGEGMLSSDVPECSTVRRVKLTHPPSDRPIIVDVAGCSSRSKVTTCRMKISPY